MTGKTARPDWDDYFMGIVREVAKRSTCDRGKVGAVIVKERRILTTGYAGAPSGQPHCDEVGHLIKDVYDREGNVSKHCIRTTHAEQNALVQAAKYGVSIDGGTLYCSMVPCFTCAKMIITAGIKRVVCGKRYHDDQLTVDLLESAGVELLVLNEEVERYEEQ